MATTSSILDQKVPLVPEPSAEGGGGAGTPETSKFLGLDMQQQKENEWCWAAVSTSVALFYVPSAAWTQCAVVNGQLHLTTCCQDGGSSACNQPSFLDQALTLVGHLNRDFGGSLTMEQIAAQVDQGKPFGLCIDWTGGGGHFVVVDGYDLAAKTIEIEDPWFGRSTVAYSSFPASYQGGGTWSWTYLTQ